MSNATHTVREELKGVLVFIGMIWAAFILNWLVFPIDFNSYGLVPRTTSGTSGILLMPFLHGSISHLLSNTIPLFVLLVLLAGSGARSWMIVAAIILIGGMLLWTFGRTATHVGASGLVFGLVVFLVLSGLFERRIVPLMMSLGVGFLYGGTLLWGVLPSAGSHVSWDGHLCGAIAGGLTAYLLTRASRKTLTTADAWP